MTGPVQLAVVGLGVMGSNLARNLARHGYPVAVHNRTEERIHDLIENYGDEGTFISVPQISDLREILSTPRIVITMISAGPATDAVIDSLADVLDPGDIIIDAGNSHFLDTRRREERLAQRSITFVGCGVSGGEEGALNGPSIMPGCSAETYAVIGPILESIAAHVGDEPCCARIGPDGAGHFVKMVHNGIEYADMQLIAETYTLLRTGLGMEPSQIADVFTEWNMGDLNSYLIDITIDVLRHTDARTGEPLVDVILDEAEQKGTGKWTVQTALDLLVPVIAISEATFARALSASAQRTEARNTFGTQTSLITSASFLEDCRDALYAAKVSAYAQGFDMMAVASTTYGWDLDLSVPARIWRAGCIIRAKLLDRLMDSYATNPTSSVLTSPEFSKLITEALPAWRRVVSEAVNAGIAVPALASTLSYIDALRTQRSSAALIQAQRDYFGAHTYRRIDMDGVFHTDWSGDGQEIAE